MRDGVVITGIGMVTPLGENPQEVLRKIEAGESASASPTDFDAVPFACPVCAQVRDFQPQRHLRETKMLRLMNRDAQLAVAAARLALQDARLQVGAAYLPDEIALYGATGLAGLPLKEVMPLMEASVDAAGEFDLGRFARAGLRAVSPLLSFKILSNMPVCFVSICENIQGPNAVFTPWEGQGAQAIEAGVRAIESGDARCALVGGCDVKTHELAFASLQQLGLFASWPQEEVGMVPGEGAVFLVLERREAASVRGARVYARLAGMSLCSGSEGPPNWETPRRALRGLRGLQTPVIVASAEGSQASYQQEADAWKVAGLEARRVIHPKPMIGNLFAAAAPLQVALAALVAERTKQRVLATCFGHGSEQAAFVLEQP